LTGRLGAGHATTPRNLIQGAQSIPSKP
jgi:hypothetical protein